jgi:hypothetical protein
MSFAGLHVACEGANDFEAEDDVDGERDINSPEAWTGIAEELDDGQDTGIESLRLQPGEDIEAAVLKNSVEVSATTDKEYRR